MKPTNSSNRVGPITDYEELRRRRELQAERTSQLINAILLSALILGAYFITRFGDTDFRLPRMWWTFMIVGAVVSLGIYVVITKVAAYAPNRKYLMTVWDALIITGAFYGLDGEIGPNTFALVALPAFVLLIASAALRLSPGPVMLSGGLSLVSYLSLFARQATPEIRLAIFLEGSMLLVATTLTAHRMVKETLGLIRESVLRTRLSRFLPARVVDEITQKPTLLEQQTRCLVATIMFVDIRGFTAMSEGKPPPQVLSIVRAFHQQVSIRVSEKGGTVLAYEGDGVMAVFGLHDEGINHAAAALEAAVSIQADFVDSSLNPGGPEAPIRIGIGLHTGEVVVGTVAVGDRLEYVVLGDAVNVTSRLQSLARQGRADVLISGPCREMAHTPRPLEQLGLTEIRGRVEDMEVWRVGA